MWPLLPLQPLLAGQKAPSSHSGWPWAFWRSGTLVIGTGHPAGLPSCLFPLVSLSGHPGSIPTAGRTLTLGVQGLLSCWCLELWSQSWLPSLPLEANNQASAGCSGGCVCVRTCALGTGIQGPLGWPVTWEHGDRGYTETAGEAQCRLSDMLCWVKKSCCSLLSTQH